MNDLQKTSYLLWRCYVVVVIMLIMMIIMNHEVMVMTIIMNYPDSEIYSICLIFAMMNG